jgi:predicted negative regulator of RcsB-dependent stress response
VDELLSEKEQLEAIRSWWRENGRYIISGVVIGVGLLLGWNYWTSQKAESVLRASQIYESLANEVAAGNADAARSIAADLYDNYGSTVYARQARLAMARLFMDKGRDEDAANELEALLQSGGDSETAMVGRLRLARILLYQDKPQEAVDLLQGYSDTAFAGRYSETLGDAYAALGRSDDARDAYTLALADKPNAPTVNRTLVQMKINDLPRADAKVSAESPSEVSDVETSGQEDEAAEDEAAEDEADE